MTSSGQKISATPLELSAAQFEAVRRIVYQKCGINLTPGKEELVKSRLSKRLQALHLDSYEAYLQFVKQDLSGKELAQMLDVLTTNKTYFYREAAHFDYLCQEILPHLRQPKFRLWSAGCSSGEEPYTIGVLLREHLKGLDRLDVRILATDLSQRVLEKARAATYSAETLSELPPALLQKHFTLVNGTPARSYRVNDNVRKLVAFAPLNLLAEWPMKGPFDVIFCRNVMIYFDLETRARLVNRYWQMLAPGGHLFIGHSESLNGINHQYKYVQPAAYIK
jgi:chemotaxis protein methyltransferase CheR